MLTWDEHLFEWDDDGDERYHIEQNADGLAVSTSRDDQGHFALHVSGPRAQDFADAWDNWDIDFDLSEEENVALLFTEWKHGSL